MTTKLLPYNNVAIKQGVMAIQPSGTTIWGGERLFKTTSKDVEYQLNNMTYNGCNGGRDSNVEKANFPSWVVALYNYIYKNRGKVPTVDDLVDFYFKVSRGIYTKDNHVYYGGNSYSMAAFKGRFLRAYPSIIRDYHVLTMLNEDKDLKYKYHYSILNDLNGVDISIYNDGIQYKFALFVDTGISNMYHETKVNNRHTRIPDIISISINIKDNAGTSFGASSKLDERLVMYPPSILHVIKEAIATDMRGQRIKM